MAFRESDDRKPTKKRKRGIGPTTPEGRTPRRPPLKMLVPDLPGSEIPSSYYTGHTNYAGRPNTSPQTVMEVAQAVKERQDAWANGTLQGSERSNQVFGPNTGTDNDRTTDDNSRTSTPPNTNTTNPATRTWDGFAGQYAPGMGRTLFENPQVVALDVLKSLGLAGDTAAGEVLGDLSYAAPGLMTLMYGSGDPKDYSDEDAINGMASYLEGLMTPGGASADQNALMDMILGADLDNNGQGSMVASLLQSGTPEEQVGAVIAMLRDVASTYANPAMEAAAIQMAQAAGDRFLQSRVRGTGGTKDQFNQYLDRIGYMGF